MCNPLALVGVPNETPPKINTRGASKDLKPMSILFPHTQIIPQTLLLSRSLVIFIIPPITNSYSYCEIVAF
jgi:hypothetical protein